MLEPALSATGFGAIGSTSSEWKVVCAIYKKVEYLNGEDASDVVSCREIDIGVVSVLRDIELSGSAGEKLLVSFNLCLGSVYQPSKTIKAAGLLIKIVFEGTVENLC